MAIKGNCSVVVAESIEDKPVTLEVKNERIESVLDALARRAGVQVNRTGNLYYIGQLRPEDKAFLVRRVRRLPPDEVRAAISVFISSGGGQSAIGGVQVYPGGLVVVGDRVEVLRRVDSMLDEIEAVPGVAWVCQLHLVDLSRRMAKDLGADVTPAAEIALAYAQGSAAGAAASAWNLTASLDAVLRAAASDGGASIVAEPSLLLLDGQPGTWERGDRIPVPRARRTDNAGGTETVVDYDYVSAGLLVRATLRESAADVAILDVAVERSQLTGFRGDAPATATDRFQSQCQVESGGVYLLGALTAQERRRNTEGPGLRVGHSAESEDRVIQVWARVHRVGPSAGTVKLESAVLRIPR